jgi:hypothetical protein
MKDPRTPDSKQSKQHVGKSIPEIRDNLDSRKEKEENYKDNNNKEGKKPNSRDKNKAGN